MGKQAIPRERESYFQGKIIPQRENFHSEGKFAPFSLGGKILPQKIFRVVLRGKNGQIFPRGKIFSPKNIFSLESSSRFPSKCPFSHKMKGLRKRSFCGLGENFPKNPLRLFSASKTFFFNFYFPRLFLKTLPKIPFKPSIEITSRGYFFVY